jgi:hypothetical protein
VTQRLTEALAKLEFLAHPNWYPTLAPLVPIVRAALSSAQQEAPGEPDSLGASPAGTALSAPALRASAPIAGALADALSLLRDIDARMRECIALGLTAAEAYDSFYQEAAEEALTASAQPVPFKVETWPLDADGHEANLCTECGTPTRYGSRHSTCGRRVIEAERAAARGMEAPAGGETEGLDPKGDSPVGNADAPKS